MKQIVLEVDALVASTLTRNKIMATSIRINHVIWEVKQLHLLFKRRS